MNADNAKKFINLCNDMLASEISQAAKAKVCSALECFLMSYDIYAGFQNLYWQKQGYNEWLNNKQPGFPEKNKYITGPHYHKWIEDNNLQFDYKLQETYPHTFTFMSAIEGEYSRMYYTHHNLNLIQ